ncbi:endo alpha-1,4 polygalactosaminidase [Tessaracoccus massiliensis]|uniref:endo alpha-1,4 polygalactosaminidase n=1 Tax=Tessaracoccus massiliensis TaxID=1522311 RepID=UPI00058FAC95|nr:endo alpha-1,4 polygalactosaminidase [Tessaracoccus massiliensis]
MNRVRGQWLAVAAALAVGLPGCAAETPELPADTGFDYQLSGAYPPPAGAGILVRDRSATPHPMAYNVCYLNGLQAQPEELAWWEAEHPGLLLRGDDGAPVIDEQWDEALFDVSSWAKRDALLEVQRGWIDACAEAGFDAVEFDNQDSWIRSAGALDLDDALTHLATLTGYAHGLGLAVAQKNQGPELGARGRDEVGFDFAIAEECAVWDECDSYIDVYGDQVLQVEYTDQPSGPFVDSCARWKGHHPIIRRDRGLVAPGEPGHHYAACG